MRSMAIACSLILCGAIPCRAEEPAGWQRVDLLSPEEVEWSGPLADALRRGVERLALLPFTADWLLADVSFKVERIFTNYSGDASGRFIELAALTSPPGRPSPAALRPVLEAVASYQRPDGHFGADVDLKKPLAKGSPPIPMLWGNARLLVGLVTAAGKTGDRGLLAAARRLGDYYAATAPELCTSARETEYRSSGTYGDGYMCCYFPAIESLALLHRATKDARYLDQARRMADLFLRLDTLPVDHSHGNLCAWRGILELFALTGERSYLERARAKWSAAVEGGYVWPTGGIGEHWMVFFEGDEGCSQSDWLRFNLDLWRFTGDTRYLELAERLLRNQYLENQTPNGGFGMRHFDGDAEGPIATRGAVDEWPFCCSFHGPLGLHFLKAYVAAGSADAVLVNFAVDFSSRVRAAGREWRIEVRTARQPPEADRQTVDVELAPLGDPGSARAVLKLRVPQWASGAELEAAGEKLSAKEEGGYVVLERAFQAGEKIRARFSPRLRIEDRRLRPLQAAPGSVTRLRGACLALGPDLLACAPGQASGRPVLAARVEASGRFDLLGRAGGGIVTVELSSPDATVEEVLSAVESGRAVVLRPLAGGRTRRRTAFAFDLVVLPSERMPAASLERLAGRAARDSADANGPFFGVDLERRPRIWLGAAGWELTPDGIRVRGGDVGLLDGEGYGDYRFDFEVVLPPEGQGITGWVVRAEGEGDCLMFQLQSADSTCEAKELKTRPNTLRPHARRGGVWEIAEPVPLPKEVRRGEAHRIAVECRGERVRVLLDEVEVYSRSAAGYLTGTVGFRASGLGEQGIFRKIGLRRL